MQASKDLIRQLPNLDQLSESLSQDTGEILARAFAGRGRPSPAGEEEVSFGIGGGVLGVAEVPAVEETNRERWVRAGVRAVNKLKAQGENADLTGEEVIGLEAIVHIEGRPAILVQDGHFFPPPDKWKFLEQERGKIEANCARVGRIEVSGHPSYEWVGTGFLVSENVIMTNRHVAQIFCKMGRRRRWVFETGMTARIDYVEELGAQVSEEFALTKVIGVHEDFDLAVFKVDKVSSSGAKAPLPMTVSSKSPRDFTGRMVYCVGYPAWDGYRNDPDAIRKIFSNIFDVKRLQPGEIMSFMAPQKQFMHDCSTLGGNSGSCVIDIETDQVIGLHFGGRYQQGNYAVALWELTNDPLIKKAKVNYV